MSWTQGIQPREDLPELEVQKLDKLGEAKFGVSGFKFQAFVWDDAEPGVIHLDYQDDFGEYRSLKLTYGDPPKTNAGVV